MTNVQPPTVLTADGKRGIIGDPAHLAANAEPVVQVHFNEQVVDVPTDSLLQQEDGSFKLMFTLAELLERQQNPPMNADEPGGTRVGPDSINDPNGGISMRG